MTRLTYNADGVNEIIPVVTQFVPLGFIQIDRRHEPKFVGNSFDYYY